MSIKKALVALFIFACAIFLVHYGFSGHAVYGDGIDYWVYLPSIYFDHDIDFNNQFRHYFEPINNNLVNPPLATVVMKTSITDIGRTDNVHPPGTAIIWSPAFIVADIGAALFSLPRQGYSDIYQITVGVWSIAIAIAGLWFCYQIVLRLTKDKKTSLLSAVAIFLTTPLLYYGAYDVLNSHFASFALTSIFWYALFFLPNKVKTQILLGALIGLATLVRFQEGLLLLPTFLYFYLKKYRLTGIINIALVWLIVISPLFFIWQYLYGVPLPIFYLHPQSTYVLKNIAENIFHPMYGVIRTPVLLLSFFGLKKFLSEHKTPATLMLIHFLLLFALFCLVTYWNAPAYGARVYVSALPFFAVLIAYSIKAFAKKFSFRRAAAIIALLAAVNIASMLSFVFLEKEVNSGRKRGLEEKTQIKVNQIIEKLKK
jgi:hypothetical protein